MDGEEDLWELAGQRAEEKAGFLLHFAAYVAVNSFLATLWYVTTGGHVFPWFLVPLFGWSIMIVVHFVATFVEPSFVDRMTRREYEALRNRLG